jgi:hypothetical protein
MPSVPTWLRQACQRLRLEIRRRYFLATALTVLHSDPPRDACRLWRSARWGGGGRLLHAYVVWTVGLVLYEVLLSA